MTDRQIGRHDNKGAKNREDTKILYMMQCIAFINNIYKLYALRVRYFIHALRIKYEYVVTTCVNIQLLRDVVNIC